MARITHADLKRKKLIKRMTMKDGKVTSEPVVTSRPYLAPLDADSKRIARIGSAVKKVMNERSAAKVK